MRYALLVLLMAFCPGSFTGARASDLAPGQPARPVLMLDAGGHTDSVPMVLFTPDGKEVISISKDKTIRTWSTATGECLRTLRVPTGIGRLGTLYAGALSRDGRTLAVGGIGAAPREFPILVLDYRSGRVRSVLKGHTATVVDIDLSADGKWLASAGEDRTVLLWNLQTGTCEQALMGHTAAVYDVAFSPDGKRLVSAAFDGTARIWSLDEGKSEAVLKDGYQGQLFRVISCAWSPDGKTIATGSADQCVRIWGADGTLRKRHGPLGDAIQSVAFTPDSREVLLTRGLDRSRDCSLMNIATGEERVTFREHAAGVWDGALSPRGDLAATAGFLGEDLLLWRTGDGSLVHRLGGKGHSTWSAAWSPDGKALAWGNTGKRTYDNHLHPLERSFRLDRLAFEEAPTDRYRRARGSSEGLSLHRLPRENAVQVRDGEQIVSTLRLNNNPPTCFSFVDADRAVVGGFFGLHLFDIRTGKQLRAFQGHTGDVWAVSPSPDNRYLLSAAADQTIRVWSLDRDEPLLSLFFAGQEWIAWTPEGYYAASVGGEKLMGWQINNGEKQLATFHPAAQFRKALYRPDVIQRLLEAGSVEKALSQADRLRGSRSQQTDVAQVLPPRVRLVSPRLQELKLTRSRLTVRAVVEAVGTHPITAVRVQLDGRPAVATELTGEGESSATERAWEIEVPPGSHRLSVRADSAVSHATSEEVVLSFTPAGTATATTSKAGTLHVLAIGINAYPGKRRLECAAPDAEEMINAFQKYSSALFKDIQPRLLLDRQATRGAILAELRSLQKCVKPGDVAIVFYAGHGDAQRAGSFHLIPVDADFTDVAKTCISGGTLRQHLGVLPCTTVLILDACFSGSIDQPRKRNTRSLTRGTDDLVRELVYDQGLVVLCGAAKEQEAAEEQGHGFFTRALVEGLSGKARRRSDGSIYLSALQEYVEERVQELSEGEQVPTISVPSVVRGFPLAKP